MVRPKVMLGAVPGDGGTQRLPALTGPTHTYHLSQHKHYLCFRRSNSLDIALTSRLARHSMPRWWTPWGLDKSFHLGDDFQTQEHVCRTYRSQLDTELHCAQLRTVLCTALRTALHCRAARRGGGLWEDHQVDLKDPYIERMDPTHPTGRGSGIQPLCTLELY